MVWCTKITTESWQDECHVVRFGSSTMLQRLTPSSATSVIVDHDYYTRGQGPKSRCLVFDSEMTMRAHIAKTAQTCFFHLRRLRQIRRLLGGDVVCTLVLAFVLSRVDYCNAVLSGLPQSISAPLQRVLNAAARVVCGLCPRDHVTDALIGLHWLPIDARIEFKLCLLVYNALNGLRSQTCYNPSPLSTAKSPCARPTIMTCSLPEVVSISANVPSAL